ncbi:pentatricopeptide repeat-containing protein At2g25580-like [Papaver somniferum]|uniref:pentatricopeptide repeat-containing protein At2g25580-like n=1 Tax=Papaver somniferum TaxID=3469 RepID=UPI000E6F88A5|nr:pentatricopeptide repeat-containing protein At2g25580-like [Papaver somniferum]
MFLGAFYACSTLCDITEGMLHFESMSKVFGIAPSMDHYVGVVKMLGSTGYLDEAFEFIENMPVEPSIDVWETLMNLCRLHGNLEIVDLCDSIVALLDPSRLNVESKEGLLPVNPSDYVIAEKNEKHPGKPLRLEDKVQQFRAGDTSEANSDELYALQTLSAHMKECGYIPELRFALHDVEDENKATILLFHSERLPLVSRLLSSPVRSQILIFKDLRTCGDCHNAFKIISTIVGRVIISRDTKRFHCFEKGKCSCDDFWHSILLASYIPAIQNNRHILVSLLVPVRSKAMSTTTSTAPPTTTIVKKKRAYRRNKCLDHDLIMEEILTKVPVKTLLRCATVTKIWYNSIPHL